MKRCVICGRFLRKGVQLELCKRHRPKFYRNRKWMSELLKLIYSK